MFDGLVLSFHTKRIIWAPPYRNFSDLCTRRVNFVSCKKHKLYYELWPIMNNTNGHLYQFFLSEGAFAEYDCCDDLFAFDYVKPDLSQTCCFGMEYRLHDAVACKIKLKNEFYASFSEMLAFLTQQSKDRMALFLCYGGMWPSQHTPVVGSINLSDFLKALGKGDIFTDVCYIIKGE